MQNEVYQILFRTFYARINRLEAMRDLKAKERYCARLIEQVLTPEQRDGDTGAEILRQFHSMLLIKTRHLNYHEGLACMILGPEFFAGRKA